MFEKESMKVTWDFKWGVCREGFNPNVSSCCVASPVLIEI